MKFQLTDEQRALQDAVRSYLRDKFGPQQVRDLYESPESDGVPAGLWKAIGEQGWLAVLVPEEHDGIGLGLLDAAVIARAFGAATVPGPWLGTILVGEAIRLAGSDEQKTKLLPGIAAGEIKGAVALLPQGSFLGAPATASNGKLTGTLSLVEYAGVADTLVVAAQDGLYLVDPTHTTITFHETLDRTVRLATVVLDDAPAEKLEASTPEIVRELIDRAAILAANDLVGIARKALTDTVEYDKTRVQFGKAVGSFQAIKHHLADIHLGITMAEHAANYAAHAQDVDADDKQLAASIAKVKTGDMANESVSAMIQYHGGIGYTWEHDSHFYFKRAKRLEYAFGDASQHRERIAQILVDGSSGAESGPIGGESGGMAVGIA
jgi:alkylation response protein AidB-like acyl-CoA dehydrogenase